MSVQRSLAFELDLYLPKGISGSQSLSPLTPKTQGTS